MSKSIAVHTDDPVQGVLRLTLRFTVESPVVVSPRLRMYVDTVAGSEGRDRILLHRVDGKKLEVDLAEAELPPDVHHRVVAVEEAERGPHGLEAVPGDAWVEVWVEADARPALHRAKLPLRTNHPELAELDIPLSVRVRPPVEVRPDVVQLWVGSESGRGRGTLVRVTHASGEEFTIRDVEVSDPEWISATRVGEDGPSRLHNVRIDLADGADPRKVAGTRTFTVTIHTDHPRAEAVEATVQVAPAGERPSRGTSPLSRPRVRPRVVRPVPTPTPAGGG